MQFHYPAASYFTKRMYPIQLRGIYHDICPVNKPDIMDMDYNTKPKTICSSLILIPTTILLPAPCRGKKEKHQKEKKKINTHNLKSDQIMEIVVYYT